MASTSRTRGEPSGVGFRMAAGESLRVEGRLVQSAAGAVGPADERTTGCGASVVGEARRPRPPAAPAPSGEGGVLAVGAPIGDASGDTSGDPGEIGAEEGNAGEPPPWIPIIASAEGRPCRPVGAREGFATSARPAGRLGEPREGRGFGRRARSYWQAAHVAEPMGQNMSHCPQTMPISELSVSKRAASLRRDSRFYPSTPGTVKLGPRVGDVSGCTRSACWSRGSPPGPTGGTPPPPGRTRRRWRRSRGSRRGASGCR